MARYNLEKIRVRIDDAGKKFEIWKDVPEEIQRRIAGYLNKEGLGALAGDNTPDIQIYASDTWQLIRLPNEMADEVIAAYNEAKSAYQAERDLQAEIDAAVAKATADLNSLLDDALREVDRLRGQIQARDDKTKALENKLRELEASSIPLSLAQIDRNSRQADQTGEDRRADWGFLGEPGDVVEPLEPVSVEPSGRPTPPNGTTQVRHRRVGGEPNQVSPQFAEPVDPKKNGEKIHREEDSDQSMKLIVLVVLAAGLLFFVAGRYFGASNFGAVILAAVAATGSGFALDLVANRKEGKSAQDRPFVKMLGQILKKIQKMAKAAWKAMREEDGDGSGADAAGA